MLDSMPSLACLIAACSVLFAQNWPQFRGPQGSGAADDQHPPVSWDLESGRGVVWKIPIPGLGHSSPVIWGSRIFLTTAISSNPNPVFEPVARVHACSRVEYFDDPAHSCLSAKKSGGDCEKQRQNL